mgnify:CR=1 FL=1
MASIQAKIVAKALGFQDFDWAKGTITEQRAKQEKTARLFKISKDVSVEKRNINGIPAEFISAAGSKPGVTLYLHGGAYALGSVSVHREFLSRLAKASQIKVLAIDYRLAPEHPFPAALEDTLAAYHWLISDGYDPATIVIAGDSAGGGLALAALLSLRDSKAPLPACAVCLSPWLNLSFTRETGDNNNDPVLNPALLSRFVRLYAGQTDPRNPLISPLFADLHGLPPLLIQAGTNEILIDEIEQFCEKARQAGVAVELDRWPGLFHVFQIVPILPETKRSLEKIANFISRKIGHSP